MKHREDEGMPFLLRYENVAWYEDGIVKILDRRIYPIEIRYEICKSYKEVVSAIKNMVTQSAGPYTSISMGLALAAYESRDLRGEEQIEFLKRAGRELASSRPTTSSRYAKIVDRSLRAAFNAIEEGRDVITSIKEDAIDSLNRRYSLMKKVGENLIELIPENGTILTQCYGETIIGSLIVKANKTEKNFKVVCAETRPFLQGARLTASCFAESGFDTTVISDNMVAWYMKNNDVSLFTSAADVITEDGFVANKIGTMQIALIAEKFGVPYYVSGIPDRGITSEDIKVEMRNPDDVMSFLGRKHTLEGVRSVYPSFDVVPPSLIKAIVTDKGKYSPFTISEYFSDGFEEFY